MHLLHPFALRHLTEAVAHVKRFRETVNPLPPKGENSQIAKDVLIDTVDASGVDLNILLPLLEEFKGMVKISGMFSTAFNRL